MFPGLGSIPPLEGSARALNSLPTLPGQWQRTSSLTSGSNAPRSIGGGSFEDKPLFSGFLDNLFDDSRLKDLSDGAKSALDAFANRLRDGDGSSGSAGGVASAPVSPQTLDFLNADLAEYYGMSRETAYQEALSNTAYQRAVKDMQDAGLNPAVIFGSGKGYTAAGVPYAQAASSGGSGGSGSSGSSGSNGHLFSSGMYNAISTASGIAGSILGKGSGKVSNYWVFSNAAKGIMSALDAMF